MFLLQCELRNGNVSVSLWIADGHEYARVSKADGPNRWTCSATQLGLGLSPLENRRSDCLFHDLFRLPAAVRQSCNTTAEGAVPVVFGPDRGLSRNGVENYLVGRDRREHFPYKSQSDRSEILEYFVPDFENAL